MLTYRVAIFPDTNGTYRVEVPDLPGTNACGNSEEQALAETIEAIEVRISMYVEDTEPVPVPSRIANGQKFVNIPEPLEQRILAWNRQFANNCAS